MLEHRIGDCHELMKTLPDNTFDLILTDPPFNVGIDYGKTTDDKMSSDGYSDWFYERLVEMERIVKDGCPIIIFSGDAGILDLFKAIERTDLIYHHFLKWSKPGGQKPLKGFVLFYRTELAFLLTKGKPNQKILNRKKMYQDTLTYKNTSSKGGDDIFAVDHPCRRPSALYAHIIEGFTKEEDLVFDPFLGSGTTLLACKITGRNGVGFEINPTYDELIKNRIGNYNPSLWEFGGDLDG